MNDNPTERCVKARIHLMLREPFLASALMRLPLMVGEFSFCSTAATDGYHIFFDSRFITSLTDSEIRGVLVHETLHVIFDHASRRQNRNTDIWNQACDYAINAILLSMSYRLPSKALYWAGFANMAAEEIYAYLLKQRKKALPSSDSRDQMSESKLFKGTLPRQLRPTDIVDASNPEVEIFVNATEKLSQGEIRDSLRNLRAQVFKEMRAAGKQSAEAKEALKLFERPQIDWKSVLRQWLYDRLKIDWSLYPPSKKHLWQGLYLPSCNAPAPGHIVLAVDTSGSMTSKQLQTVFSEVRSFRESFPCRMTVIQADTQITRIDKFEAFEQPDQNFGSIVFGRGGTDFRPVFSWLDRQDEKGVCLIYATDGWGSFPSTSNWPVIWLHTQENTQHFPAWGLLVPLGRPSE